MYDLIKNIRNEFPILNKTVNNKKIVYFDNASSTQKPLRVIEAISKYYFEYNCNIERGFYNISSRLAHIIENTRKKIKNFVNAEHSSEIIFTSGTTEGINLVSHAYSKNLKKDDLVILSLLEHHSNILPWQKLALEKGFKIEYIPILNSGDLDVDYFDEIIQKRPKLVSITYISNALGTINDLEYIIKKSHNYGAKVLVDAAQAPSHLKLDVQKLDCDFLAFSSHKMFGPMGLGVLYIKKEVQKILSPYKLGGGMVDLVTLEKYSLRKAPYKFEAGTLNYASIFALNTTIDFINEIDIYKINAYENFLKNYTLERLKNIEEIKIIGNPKNRAPIIAFKASGCNDLDVGMLLDANGIAVRTGSQCAQPLMNFLKLDGVVRISLSLYNNEKEIIFFVEVLKKILKKLKK